MSTPHGNGLGDSDPRLVATTGTIEQLRQRRIAAVTAAHVSLIVAIEEWCLLVAANFPNGYLPHERIGEDGWFLSFNEGSIDAERGCVLMICQEKEKGPSVMGVAPSNVPITTLIDLASCLESCWTKIKEFHDGEVNALERAMNKAKSAVRHARDDAGLEPR